MVLEDLAGFFLQVVIVSLCSLVLLMHSGRPGIGSGR